MTRRIRTLLCQGAASALFVAGPAFAEPEEIGSLPHWMLRAQQRLALEPVQRRELRLLVDDNAGKLRSLERQPDAAQAPHRGLERMQIIQREFREGLARILRPDQLAQWDALLEELLAAVHLRNAPMLAESRH
jgi:hypothetical protein